MNLKTIITITLLMVSCAAFAQQSQPARQKSEPQQAEDAQRAKYKQEIGLDMSVPDFQTKSINPKVMGARLAGILNYLMENYHQGVYDRRLCQIASEQNETLENVYLQIKKMKFVNAVKKGTELTIMMRAEFQKITVNVKQTDIVLHFVDGISESDKVNELFTYISHYVQAREQLDKQ